MNNNHINNNHINNNHIDTNSSTVNNIKCCIRKDIYEVSRTGKLILFLALSLGMAVMIMAFTIIFTDVPDALTSELPDLDISSLESMMSTLYPKMLRESLGVYAYYIGVFYSLIVILVCNNILPREKKEGKWILPKEQGYKCRDIIVGKCLVYGCASGLAVTIGYLMYFIVASAFMERNMTFGNAFVCSLVHGLNMFFIIAYTFLFSVWFKSGVAAAISIIGTVLFAPDILRWFEIGKYFPTYLLTFVYDSSDEYGSIVAPLVINLILLVFTYVMATEKAEKL